MIVNDYKNIVDEDKNMEGLQWIQMKLRVNLRRTPPLLKFVEGQVFLRIMVN